MPAFDRITFDPAVMVGRLCIRGMRLTVGNVLGQLAAGRSISDVLADYPYLERADIDAALSYAAWRVKERDIPVA